ncbi:myrosinase 1-like [Diorhabda carinulata]|uniref:myrosinase 1-like n=1 Tax=Diorhabda carinulata TaxID=1163345 RepID=UPI0025A224D3|nr:myrosinase 1-like [Diorhabda carinulata]
MVMKWWLFLTGFLVLNVAAGLKRKGGLRNNGSFPKKFIFGVATSAFQTEGGWDEDGKGQSIWDNFTHIRPSKISNGDTADVACDSYHRFKEDVQNVKKLGTSMYRFSIAWTRILPTGYSDNINQKGLDYYKELVKVILEFGLIPVATIYQWDLPQRLVDDGNDWRSEKIIPIFLNYSRIVIQNLPDVKIWITINEPKQICHSGYGTAFYPPMINGDGTIEYQCMYIILKAHAAVYRMYKKEFPHYTAKMTMVIDCQWSEPYSQDKEDIIAADRVLQFECGVYFHPLCTGDWPEVVKKRIYDRSLAVGLPESRLPAITESDKLAIMGAYDFIGLNHYTTNLVEATDGGLSNETSYDNDIAAATSFSPSWVVEALDSFAIVPKGLYYVLTYVNQVCNKADILITELGMAEDGSSLDDQIRIDFYQDYLCNMLEAMKENVNVIGVIFWSLMDNFEWRSGYYPHFGLYHMNATDDPTLTRTPKKSVGFVQELIRSRKLECDKSRRKWPHPRPPRLPHNHKPHLRPPH